MDGTRVFRSYAPPLAMSLVLAACGGDRTEPSFQRSQPAPAAEVKEQPLVAPADAGTTVVDASDAAAGDAGAGDAGASIAQPLTGPEARAVAAARAKLVTQLLEPKLATMTPEQVVKRYKQVPLVRGEPLPTSVELHARTPNERLKFGFLSKPGVAPKFTNAMLEIVASTPEEASAVYQQLVAVVQKKLGKALSVKESPPYFAQTFKLSDKLDVNVGAVAAAQPRPYVAMTIVLSRPPL